MSYPNAYPIGIQDTRMMEADKHSSRKCEYCGTPPRSRDHSNCINCGAPRKEDYES